MELTNFKEIKDIILKRWKKGDILREYFREKNWVVWCCWKAFKYTAS